MVGHITEEYINTHHTKKNKVTCPSCGGNDLGIIPGGRVAHCFECGDNYRIGDQKNRETINEIQFDTDAIRVMYGAASQYYHSCISAEHEEYLQSRGINKAAIDLFRIGFCPPGSSALYSGVTARQAGLADSKGNPWLANRIVFPYIADTGTVTDLRGRAIGNGDPRYLSLYHKSEKRGAVYPFNYDRSVKRSFETKTLIITEGEIKAVVADIHGFAVTALPGMSSYRKGLITQPGVSLVVIYDSTDNPLDRQRVDTALRKLSERLPRFSVVTLPLFGEKKMDIDTFLLLGDKTGGAQRLQYYIDNAVEYTTYRKLRIF